MRRLATLILVLLPGLVMANEIMPSQGWLDRVAVEKPLFSWRLGMVTVEGDTSKAYVADLSTALRATLQKVGFFSKDKGERAHILLNVKQLKYGGEGVGEVAEVEYQLRIGGRVVYRTALQTSTTNLFSFEDADRRILSGNLKSFVIGLRKAADRHFVAEHDRLAGEIAMEVNRRSVMGYVGEGVARGVYGVVSTGVEVAQGVGEVLASEEFYSALSAMNEQAQADAARSREALASTIANAQTGAESHRRSQTEKHSIQEDRTEPAAVVISDENEPSTNSAPVPRAASSLSLPAQASASTRPTESDYSSSRSAATGGTDVSRPPSTGASDASARAGKVQEDASSRASAARDARNDAAKEYCAANGDRYTDKLVTYAESTRGNFVDAQKMAAEKSDQLCKAKFGPTFRAHQIFTTKSRMQSAEVMFSCISDTKCPVKELRGTTPR
ncbi:MAG: hypothetical protein ACOY4U_05730 [Pseudomonadota bacterium]